MSQAVPRVAAGGPDQHGVERAIRLNRHGVNRETAVASHPLIDRGFADGDPGRSVANRGSLRDRIGGAVDAEDEVVLLRSHPDGSVGYGNAARATTNAPRGPRPPADAPYR